MGYLDHPQREVHQVAGMSKTESFAIAAGSRLREDAAG
jgi:hypothetical protein